MRLSTLHYTRAVGIAFTLAGLIGLLLNREQDQVESLVGLQVNLTHNLIHLGTGLLGLLAGFALLVGARSFALAVGLIYTTLGLVGLVVEHFDGFGLLYHVNLGDDIFHLIIGLLGLLAAFTPSYVGEKLPEHKDA